jgi:hypothetical protein
MLKRRLCVLIAVLVCGATAGCSGAQPSATQQPRETSTATPPAGRPATTPATPPSPDPQTWASWALLDRTTGTIAVAGGVGGTSTTESMIKIGVVAQFLADLQQVGRQPTQLEKQQMSAAIRDSDNDAAEDLYRKRFGDVMLRKLLATCRLHDSTTKAGWWSETQMTAADAARMGECIASGRVAGGEWTTWILGEMRSVRGVGRFGIIEAHPQDDGQPLAIKNGWTQRPADGLWHVNCLAVTAWWTLAVMIRYPASRDLAYGARWCRDVAAAIIPKPPAPTVTPTRSATN